MKHFAVAAAVVAGLTACSSVGFGVSFPIGGVGGVGVGVSSDGRVGGSVGVGTGNVSVGVGGSTTLPRGADPAASAASGATK